MTLVEQIRGALYANADASLAPAQRAYMKSAMPFLGVRVPAVRAIVRDVTRSAMKLEGAAAELVDCALALWRAAEHREERYAALAVMALRPLRGDPRLLGVHEEMIRSGAWWDLVDEAARRLREILDVDPQMMGLQMRVWADDDDLWIRRAAIISQLGRGERTDRGLLAYVIRANLDEPEFFLRKAIGWALRDLGRHDPHWVREFVSQHPRLSSLSRREAMKHLE